METMKLRIPHPIWISFWIWIVLLINPLSLNMNLSESKSVEHGGSAPGFDEDLIDPININMTNGTLEFDLEEVAMSRRMGQELRVSEYDSGRRLECQGENIQSLSLVQCDSLEDCEEKKPCVTDRKKCLYSDYYLFSEGRKCSVSLYEYDSSGESGSSSSSSSSKRNCYHIRLPSYGSGMVQCTSVSKREDGQEEKITTIDHFYYGHNANESLLSKSGNLSSGQIKIRVYVESLHEDLNETAKVTSDGRRDVILYTNEEILTVECRAPKFLFKKDNITLAVYRKDGTTLNLGEGMLNFYRWDLHWRVVLESFRVPSDIVAFACAAQGANSTEWVENRVNVTVKDPPSSVNVRLESGKNQSVDLTAGSTVKMNCNLTGDSKMKAKINNNMRILSFIYGVNEIQIGGVIDFLRFQEVADGNYFCKILDPNDQSMTSGEKIGAKSVKVAPSTLIVKPPGIFVNFSPSAPKIYKPAETTVKLRAQDENVMKQTLHCNFRGEPKPLIIWMKNGKELYYAMISFDVEMPGNETMEHVTFPLGALEHKDFDESGILNYSCIAQNHFGRDRLDFIISENQHQNQNQNPRQNQNQAGTIATTTTKTKSTVALPDSTSVPPPVPATSTTERTTTTVSSTSSTTPQNPVTISSSPPQPPPPPPATTSASTSTPFSPSSSEPPAPLKSSPNLHHVEKEGNENSNKNNNNNNNSNNKSYKAALTSLLVIIFFVTGVGLVIFWRKNHRAPNTQASPTGGRIPIPRFQFQNQCTQDPMYKTLLEESHS